MPTLCHALLAPPLAAHAPIVSGPAALAPIIAAQVPVPSSSSPALSSPLPAITTCPLGVVRFSLSNVATPARWLSLPLALAVYISTAARDDVSTQVATGWPILVPAALFALPVLPEPWIALIVPR